MRRTLRALVAIALLLALLDVVLYLLPSRRHAPPTVPTSLVATPTPTSLPPPSPVSTPPPTLTPAPSPPSDIPTGVIAGPLVFHDEFDGASLDTTRWAFPADSAGLGGEQHWDPDACRVTDGVLHVTARLGSPTGAPYTSCALWTQGKQSVGPYGYWEMRARIPPTAGTWPAFWSVAYDRRADPALDVWEMDVMEAVYHTVADANIVSWNLHARNASGQDDDFERISDPNNLGGELYTPRWHTYGMEWRADHVAWYVDGVEQFRVREGEVIGGKTVRIPGMRQVVILQMAVGGLETVETGGLPATMDVDYVRVYA